MKADRKKFSFKGFWLRLWKLLAPFHREMIFYLAIIAILEIIRLGSPYLLKLIIDLLAEFKKEDVIKIIYLAVSMFGLNQLLNLIDYFLDKRLVSLAYNIEKYLPILALKKLLSLSLGYHEKENTGNKIIKIERGVDKIDNLLGNIFWEVAPTIMQTIATAIALLFIDYRFSIIFVIFAPLFAYLSYKGNQIVLPWRTARYNAYEDSSGQMVQSIININTVQSFVQEKKELSKFEAWREKILDLGFKEFKTILKFNVGRSLLIDLGRLIFLAYGVYLAWQGQISLGTLVFVITVSEKALISFFRISRLYDRIMESSEAIDRLSELDKEESVIKSPSDGIRPQKIDGKIEFKNVNFRYGEKNRLALDDVSFEINSGCVTALVGPSGGGKTTLVRLIYRHYDPNKEKF
jgi:ABC-type multidrug transport system fused ATPase/permease subunit